MAVERLALSCCNLVEVSGQVLIRPTQKNAGKLLAPLLAQDGELVRLKGW